MITTSCMSSIRALGPIMDAVGDRIEVHLDSGIRSGQDVLKAIAMGAKGTFIQKVSISSTMGPGIKLDLASAQPQ